MCVGFVMCVFCNVYFYLLCFLYCFIYVYLFLFALSVLTQGLLPPSDNSIVVSSSSSINGSNHNKIYRKSHNICNIMNSILK